MTPFPGKSLILIALTLIAAPIVVFYSILFRHIINVPMFDDYAALLGFLNQLTRSPTLREKLIFFLSSQHNEYKLVFEEAIFWVQLHFSGHANLPLLCILGNGFMLLIAILLWKMFPPEHVNFATRLALFIPVPWLLFQLQYAQTLDFPMGALQNLPVVFFAFAAIQLLCAHKRGSYYAALICLILTVFSSGNGLAMIPVGLLMLWRTREYKKLAGWALTSVICLATYMYAYSPAHWLTASRSFTPPAANFWRPLFVVSLIGSAGAYPIQAGGIVLGIALCVFYLYAWRRAYFHSNPRVGYAVLFLIPTVLGLTGFRSNFSLITSVSSTYTIYSTLFLIFAWFAVVEIWLSSDPRPLWRSPCFWER